MFALTLPIKNVLLCLIKQVLPPNYLYQYFISTFIFHLIMLLRNLFTSLLTMAFCLTAQAQQSSQFWQDIAEASIVTDATRYIIPNQYRSLALDIDQMRRFLSKSPMERIGQRLPANALIIQLPMPDGTWQGFQIVESPVMHPDLAAQFPAIKTYAGQGIDDPTATLRLDITLQGFHAMVLTSNGDGTIFIDPYALNDTRYYISYYKRNYTARGKSFLELDPIDHNTNHDELHSKQIPNDPNSDELSQQLFSTDGKHRNYRLALAATGEYTTFHGGTVALAASAMATTMNRINGVYERELSVRMTLIANNNNLIYTNGSSDPYSNNDGYTMLSQNVNNCNTVIGSANYDIGHVFSTGGGGIACLGCVCTSSKAEGVTGSGSPVGDPFDIDYVAHEMGHQFDCNHTFNTTDGSCGGNREASAAYEIGSGSTIMSYAGICSPSNVQNNSDDYFHAGSLAEVLPYIVSGGGNNCPVKTNIAHTAPTTDAGSNYTIPKSTPFMLTGSATDDDTGLTYCWEEMDLGSAASLSAALAGNAPAFRSYDPTTSPTRVLPRMQTVMAGTTDNNEKLPNYARTMNFRLTVRDNHSGSGRVGSDNMTVAINGTAGPFLVTAPNTTGISVPALSTYTVTWDVAGTTASPVSCANVDIYLIINNAASNYPQTLILANTPNDGTQSITIPNNPTTQARILVKGSNNIFFDVSNSNFTITAATTPDFSLNIPNSTQNICAPANATYAINTTQIAGLTTPIVFSATGLPAGTNASFAPSSVTPGNSSTLTVSNTGSAAAGSYTVTVTGTAGSLVRTASVVLNIAAGQVAAVSLTSPANATAGTSPTPTFTWSPANNASTYDIQIATDAAFANVVASANNLIALTYTPATPLSGATTYFWRVRGINGCGNGTYSAAFVFATGGNTCTNFVSSDVPKTISTSGAPTVNSTVSISSMSNVTDVDVLNIQGTHSYMGDLRFRLLSASGTNIILHDFSSLCSSQSNFNVNFDDDAAAGSVPCATTGGTYRSASNALTTLDGQNPIGTWTLRIEDVANQDGGSLNSWTLRLCQTGSGALSGGATATLKVLLEGAYSSGTMSTALKTANLLPLSQPYSPSPFGYAGGEAVAAQSNLPTNMTDWILVEAWNGTTLVERRAAWLLSDGSVVEPGNVSSGVKFFNLQNGQSYSIAIRHRNHVAIISTNPVAVSSNTLSYDFTTAVSQALGNAQQIGSGGKALMRAGDLNANGVITFADYNIYRNAAAGYHPGDANLSGTISTTDFNFYRSNAGHIGMPILRY